MRVGYGVVVCCCLGYRAYVIDCENFKRYLALNTDVEINSISSNNSTRVKYGVVVCCFNKAVMGYHVMVIDCENVNV